MNGLIHTGETYRLDIYLKNISRSEARYAPGVNSTVKGHGKYLEDEVYATEITNSKSILVR